MIALIDTIFKPLLTWLATIKSYIGSMSVPLSRPIEIADYLGPFALLGSYWVTFISTTAVLAFIYVIAYMVMSMSGLAIKFKDLIKWW